MKQNSTRRIAPPREKAMQNRDYNPLHYAYLLWVDYLRAATEEDKQQLLVEAASTLTVYGQCGREGEEVIALVAQAIHSRTGARGRMNGTTPCIVQTSMEGNRHKFAILAA